MLPDRQGGVPNLRRRSADHGMRSREAGPTTGPPKLATLVPEWHDQAAWAGEEDANLWFAEPSALTTNANLHVSPLLLTTLICAACPVRRKCLEAAFAGITYPALIRETTTGLQKLDAPNRSRTMGTWGRTVEAERNAVHDLPASEAIEVLEDTLQQRIEARTAAWRETVAGRALSMSGKPRLNKRELPIVQLLGLRVEDLGGTPYVRPTSLPLPWAAWAVSLLRSRRGWWTREPRLLQRCMPQGRSPWMCAACG